MHSLDVMPNFKVQSRGAKAPKISHNLNKGAEPPKLLSATHLPIPFATCLTRSEQFPTDVLSP